MFLDILLLILLIILIGCVGAYIGIKVLEKETDELIDSFNALVKCQRDIMSLDDELIEDLHKMIDCKDAVIHNTYLDLVKLRDAGTENLDEVIGVLGEVLDDHKEANSECSSDQ